MNDHPAGPAHDQLFFFEQQTIHVEDFAASGPILDLGGGGEGVIGQLKGEQVVAIDPSKRELEEAAPGPLKIIMDATDLQFLDETFSVMTGFFTLMYIDRADHEKVFREALRVLAPGGQFLIWDVNLPRRQDGKTEFAVFPVHVTVRDREIISGYATKWPEETQDLGYYIEVAERVGFEVAAQSVEGWAIYLGLQKS